MARWLGMASSRKALALAMMGGDDRDWQRLARYVTGESTPEEAEATRQWLEDDASRRELYQRMRETYELSRERSIPWNSSAAWQRLSQRIASSTAASMGTAASAPARDTRLHSIDPFVSARKRSRHAWVMGAAAALLLTVAGGVTARVALRQRAASVAVTPVPVAMNEVVTRRAQRATVQLVDGTRITLNVDSRLRYPQGYGVSARDLYLEGEAYFDVGHGALPFVVHTAQGKVRDIGTRFVVSAYPSGAATQVVVTDGAVVLSRDAAATRDSLVLTAAMLGTLTSPGELSATVGVDVTDHTAWMEGRLVFVGAPLADVVTRLSRWYDVDIRLADPSLADVRFSGTYRSENPESVLRLLAASVGSRVSRSGSAFVLSVHN